MQPKLVFFAGLGACAMIALSARPASDAAGSGTERPQTVASTLPASRETESEDAGGPDEMVLLRGSSGQFNLTAQVDGQDTEFLVDTGADMVALTVEEAERLGFAVDPAQFRPLTQTASGTGYGTVVRLASLEVAGSRFHDVDAAVLDGLPVNLLGQSVLSRLGAVSLEGDRMVIRR